MASLTLTIPDAQLPRLVLAIAQQTGQDSSTMTTPQKVAMVKADIVTLLIGRIQSAELPAAEQNAVQTRIADIVANVTIT